MYLYLKLQFLLKHQFHQHILKNNLNIQQQRMLIVHKCQMGFKVTRESNSSQNQGIKCNKCVVSGNIKDLTKDEEHVHYEK